MGYGDHSFGKGDDSCRRCRTSRFRPAEYCVPVVAVDGLVNAYEQLELRFRDPLVEQVERMRVSFDFDTEAGDVIWLENPYGT
jgi:hypothetical protein